MDTEIIQEYRKKVINFLLIIITFSATAAGITFPVLKAMGFFSTVSWGIVIFLLGVF